MNDNCGCGIKKDGEVVVVKGWWCGCGFKKDGDVVVVKGWWCGWGIKKDDGWWYGCGIKKADDATAGEYFHSIKASLDHSPSSSVLH